MHMKNTASNYWSRFLDISDAVSKKPTTRQKVKFYDELFELTKRIYTYVDLQVRERLEELRIKEADAARRAVRTNDHRPVDDVRLPRVPVAVFDGAAGAWPRFKDIFEQYFIKQTSDGASRFYYLDLCLKPGSEPETLIAGIDRTHDNFQVAWDILCGAYNNNRKIVDDIIGTFLKLQAMTGPTRQKLIDITTATNRMIESLKRYNIGTEHWDPLVVAIIERKLDKRTMDSWIMKRPQRAIAKLKPLIDFLVRIADGLNDNEDRQMDSLRQRDTNRQTGSFRQRDNYRQMENSRQRENSRHRERDHQRERSSIRGSSRNTSRHRKHSSRRDGRASESGSNTDSNRKPKIIPQCQLCTQRHRLWACSTFKSLPVPERKIMVKRNKFCEKCLERHANDKQCKMKPCIICQEPHNSLLCEQLMLHLSFRHHH